LIAGRDLDPDCIKHLNTALPHKKFLDLLMGPSVGPMTLGMGPKRGAKPPWNPASTSSERRRPEKTLTGRPKDYPFRPARDIYPITSNAETAKREVEVAKREIAAERAEQEARRKEREARRKEAELLLKEEGVLRKEQEAIRMEEDLRRKKMEIHLREERLLKREKARTPPTN
jgi:hypothetical protein